MIAIWFLVTLPEPQTKSPMILTLCSMISIISCNQIGVVFGR